MKDIDSRTDIELLLDTFYDKLFEDDLLQHFFKDHMPIGREAHMPILYNFWESMLLGSANYSGNPMEKHMELDKKTPLRKEHFSRWLELREGSVDELFEGAKAKEAKQRAKDIARLRSLRF